MSRLRTVTLTAADWSHVVNAVASSFDRKVKRKDGRAADEMALIGRSIIRQVAAAAPKQPETTK